MNYNVHEIKTEKCYESTNDINQCRITGEICTGFKACSFYKTKEQFEMSKAKREARLSELGYVAQSYEDSNGVRRMGMFKEGKHVDFKEVAASLNKVVEVFTYIQPLSAR